MKTSLTRRPQNVKTGKSQKPLIVSSSKFKLKLRDQTKIENRFKGRKTTIFKVEYLTQPLEIVPALTTRPQITNW